MARIRRPKKIDGSEYTFGGGSGSASAAGGDLVKIAKGSMSRSNTSHDGFLSNGDTVTVVLDAGSSIPTKDQYIYFDNAFESATGSFTYEFTNGDTALPAGVSWSTNADSVDADAGEARFYGTPSVVGTNTFKIKSNYPSGTDAEQVEITYVLRVLPTGTTPVWDQMPSSFPDRFIRNTDEEVTIFAGPTTSYSGATYSLSNVSGFAAGVTPIIESDTGRVYIASVGDIEAAATAHSLTVNVDLGEYGVVSQTFTGSVAYGDAYGARYFGPANASANLTSSANYNTLAASDAQCNPVKSTGALRRYTTNAQDTSPYLLNDGYGCMFRNNMNSYINSSVYGDTTSAYTKNGIMGFGSGATQMWSSTTNHAYALFRWVVPTGVTSISMVAVGGGGPGMYNWSADGGGGGGLAWLNGVDVTPGQEFQICVGLGRYSEANNSSYGAGPSWVRDLTTGDCLIYGQGGGWHGHTSSSPNGQSTSYTGGVSISGITDWTPRYSSNANQDGGGWGVNTNYGSTIEGHFYGGGTGQYTGGYSGGGAGGYRGASGSAYNANNGQWGGGGGGWYYSSTYGTGAGGGVGLDGQGHGGSQTSAAPSLSNQAGSGHGGNKSAWTSFAEGASSFRGGGGGGSGGSRGSYGQNNQSSTQGEYTGQRTTPGGVHGGGGGGSGTSWGGGHGAPGGVRIIWGRGVDGTQRCFPYNYASERPDMKVAGTV